MILRSHWNNAIVELARKFGADNVFVSVYESGSWDNTKGALQELDQALEKLGVSRNITLSDVTHRDEIAESNAVGPGWIDTPRREKGIETDTISVAVTRFDSETARGIDEAGREI